MPRVTWLVRQSNSLLNVIFFSFSHPQSVAGQAIGYNPSFSSFFASVSTGQAISYNPPEGNPGCLQIFLMLLVWLHFSYVSTHYHCSSSIVALPRMSPQGAWSSMVVVPWIPLVAIDVEVDVPCIHPPCNLDYNVWDPSNLEMNWGLIHSHGCLQLSALSS